MTRALCRDCCEIVDAPHAACGRCGGARLVAHAEIESLGIAHIDCDAFYASVEKRDRPELAREPLIVGHAGGRGVVVTACYIARTVRRPLGHADVPGAGAVPARHGDRTRTWPSTSG